jgi:hypothetical protein
VLVSVLELDKKGDVRLAPSTSLAFVPGLFFSLDGSILCRISLCCTWFYFCVRRFISNRFMIACFLLY